jgi:hypothetical protein
MFGAKGLITAPHYLAEKIIKKRIEKKGITIPNRIWDKKFLKDLEYKYWHGAYFGEYKKACEILKKYDEDCVIKAIDSYECKLVLSLYNQTFERIIKELQKVKAQKESIKEKVENFISFKSELPKKQPGTKSRLSKLK